MTHEVIEGEVTEQSLALVPPKEIALSTQDPTEFLERAVKQADALKRVIDQKGLAISIGGTKKHVLIDGWQTLMALNGVMPFTVSCEKQRDENNKLTVHVVTEIRRVNDGTVLTRVETECSQHERRWSSADDYAVISMAQTRGVGKGCRQLFGWVMSLAGYSATPAEEMPEPEKRRESAPVAPPSKRADDTSGDMTSEQRATIDTLRMRTDNDERVNAAAKVLKEWGFKHWADFLVHGTQLQAAEIERVLTT